MSMCLCVCVFVCLCVFLYEPEGVCACARASACFLRVCILCTVCQEGVEEVQESTLYFE